MEERGYKLHGVPRGTSHSHRLMVILLPTTGVEGDGVVLVLLLLLLLLLLVEMVVVVEAIPDEDWLDGWKVSVRMKRRRRKTREERNKAASC